MNKNKICSSCNTIIPLGRSSCPECYNVAQRRAVDLSYNKINMNSGHSNDPSDESLISCLFDLSFNKYAILIVAKLLYLISIVLCIILIFSGICFSFNFYSKSILDWSEWKLFLTSMFFFASITLPLVLLLITRILIEFAIAIIKTAENTGKIMEIAKRI